MTDDNSVLQAADFTTRFTFDKALNVERPYFYLWYAKNTFFPFNVRGLDFVCQMK